MLDALTRRLYQVWSDAFPDRVRPRHVRYVALPGSVEGGTATLLAFADGQAAPVVVVKVHRDPDSSELVERERAVLDLLHARGEFFRASVPRVLFAGRVDGAWVVAQSVLEGRPMLGGLALEASPELERARANLDVAVDWLIQCHRGSETAPDASGWSIRALALVAEFQKVFDLAGEDHAYIDALRDRIEGLARRPVRWSVRHGDFGRHNLLLSAARGAPRLRVIDWTFSQKLGLPLHDLVFFLGTYGLQARKTHGLDSLDAVFDDTFVRDNGYSRLVAGCLARYGQALEIERDLLASLFHLAIIDQALTEYHRVVRAMERGSLPRLTLYLALAEGRTYEDAARAQLWVRFFRRLARAQGRLVA